MGITFQTKCTKCGTTLGRQALFAMAIDAGGNAPDPCECPEGGDHDFAEEDTPQRAPWQEHNSNPQGKPKKT